MRIVNAGQASFPGAWRGYNVCASYDRSHWFRWVGAGACYSGGRAACCAGGSRSRALCCAALQLWPRGQPLVWQAGCLLWFPVAASRQREAGKLLYCGLLPSCRRVPMATSCSLVAREVPCHIMAPCPSLLARRVPTEYHEAEGVLSWTHTPTKGAVYYVSWSSAGWPAYMQGRRQAGCVQGTGAHV